MLIDYSLFIDWLAVRLTMNYEYDLMSLECFHEFVFKWSWFVIRLLIWCYQESNEVRIFEAIQPERYSFVIWLFTWRFGEGGGGASFVPIIRSNWIEQCQMSQMLFVHHLT